MSETVLTLILIIPTAAALAIGARWALTAPPIAEATNKLLHTGTTALAAWTGSLTVATNDALEAAYADGYVTGKADAERLNQALMVPVDQAPLADAVLAWAEEHLDVKLMPWQVAYIKDRYR